MTTGSRRQQRRRRRGVSLLEVLFAVAIGAIVLAGVAGHLRTLRQTFDMLLDRHEALQSGRVALDRMARVIRAARAIEDIRPSSDPDGSIAVVGPDGTLHVFARSHGELLYGIDEAEHLLASGVEALRFQGHNADGEVDPDEPENIEAVQISLTVAVAGSGETLDLATRVHLRNKGSVRGGDGYVLAYATGYEPRNGGLSNGGNALGAPDGQYALGRGSWGAEFSDFDPGDKTGTVARIFVGLYLRHVDGDGLDIKIKRGRRTLVNAEYKDCFDGYGTAGWWWLDITATGSAWDHDDIDDLKIEIGDSGGGEFDFDSVVVLACFEEPETLTYWADREGGVNYPREWLGATSALDAPDQSYATGKDSSSYDSQSYRVTAAATGGESPGLHPRVCHGQGERSHRRALRDRR